MSIYDPATTLWQDSFSNGMFTIQPPIVTGTCTINSFIASPSVVVWNTPTTLYWNTNCANITILGIYPYTGQNLGPSGTISSGSLTTNTNFTLYGSNNPGCLGTVYSTTTGQPCSYVTSNTAATVTPQNQSITLVSPNGGEIWQPGTPLVVRWNSANIPASTLLEVNIYSINGPIAFGFLAPNGTPNDGVESFSTANLPNGYYKVIVGVPSAGLNNSALSTSDESDAPFMIQSTPVTSCSINFFTATPSTINVGGSSTLKWTTQGCNNIVFNGSSVPRNGTVVVTPTQTTTYTVYAGTFPNGCSSFTGYSSTTGQPCVNGAITKTVTVAVPNGVCPTVTMGTPNYNRTIDSNGNITSVTYSIPLSVQSCVNTVYLGQAAQYGSTTTASRSVSFVFNNSFAPLVDDVVSSAAWALTSSDALIEGNAFRLDAGTTKHFTLTVTLLSPSIPNSSYRVHLKQLKSFTNAALTVQNSLLDLTQYKTDYQLINN